MRIRSIKPDYWRNEAIGTLPREMRFFGVALLNLADDDGYFRTHPALIAGDVLPFDDDGKAFVVEALKRFAAIGFVELLGDGIGRVATFKKHQVINRPTPSRLNPEQQKLSIEEPNEEPKAKRKADEDSRSAPGVLSERSRGEVEVEVEVEVERGSGNGTGKPAGEKPPAAADPRLKLLTATLVAIYQIERGCPYKHGGAVDTLGLRSLLPLADDEEIRARWRKGLRLGGAWPGCSTLAELASSKKWNALAAKAAKGPIDPSSMNHQGGHLEL